MYQRTFLCVSNKHQVGPSVNDFTQRTTAYTALGNALSFALKWSSLFRRKKSFIICIDKTYKRTLRRISVTLTLNYANTDASSHGVRRKGH